MNDLADQTAEAEAEGLAARLAAGERAALARALSRLEAGGASARALLSAVAPRLGRALVVGFTGPPGAGKSTLVGAYVAALRAEGRSVGVIAVDPSSPASGGAILGDRVRMSAHQGDDGVFVRSLASRGHVGGLSPAAVRAIDAFDAAGRDVVALETVGAGQSEIDVAEIADIKVVVCAPGLGDGLQAMKSGILEIADVLVVNKADLPAAARTEAELRAALSLRPAGAGATPVLRTAAARGAGAAELRDAIDAAATLRRAPVAERRRRRAQRLLAWAAMEEIERLILAGGAQAAALADEILAAETAPAEAARRLLLGRG